MHSNKVVKIIIVIFILLSIIYFSFITFFDNSTKESIKDFNNTKININNINDSNSLILIDNHKVIEENRELKMAIELLFGKNYESFLKEQKKSNPQLIIYLSKILKGKDIFETIEILKDEIAKREKLQKELERAKKEATSQRLKEILPKAEKALAEFKYEEYHKILSEFRNSTQNIIKDTAKTYYLEANAYYDRLEYKKAVEIMKEALYFDRENTTYLNTYGFYMSILAKYNEAIKYFNKALQIDLKTFDKNNPNIARDYNNLGEVYLAIGKNNEAIEYFNKALEIDLKNFDENHPNIATYYNNLGEVYLAQGKNDKAIAYFNKALKIDLKVFGKNHPNIARDNNNLGEAFRAKGEYDKAIEYYSKALAIDLKNFSENHPNVATYYNNLGVVYMAKGEYDKAIEYYNKALSILTKIFQDGHPYIERVKENLQKIKDSKKLKNDIK